MFNHSPCNICFSTFLNFFNSFLIQFTFSIRKNSDDVTDEAHPKTTGLEDGLFGSDDEDEDNNTIKDVTSTELEKAIKEIGSHDADAFETWRPKNWYSALTEKLGIDFTAQPELKDKVMDLIEKIITVEEPNKDSSLFGSDEDR